ncbi:related to conserved hypothetical Ustilaginaceae-specific protein [Ustilago trichophora]|uniref:Related to conserved hypothetical Ustilaginaceae-specific protein n=1 Tax=Ustilago trichophora TaxID=86804 RepID=A0A5C3DVU0_9BASI|nr:related to conserved hypothetical Ustilaginaceae-specific protein [Ustilago trichophora]
MMQLPTLVAPLVSLLMTRLAISANSANALFDSSPLGQAEWRRYCSPAASNTAELLPHACFTIHDDITSAAHSASHERLGFASASGEEFVVIAPKADTDSKVDFYACGFWFKIEFSASLGCTKVAVWAPTRAGRRMRREGQEAALEPFMQGVSCHPSSKKTFNM